MRRFDRAAERGAERRPAHLVWDNGHHIRELRDLTGSCATPAARLQVTTIAAATTGILAALLVGAAIKKLNDGSNDRNLLGICSWADLRSCARKSSGGWTHKGRTRHEALAAWTRRSVQKFAVLADMAGSSAV